MPSFLEVRCKRVAQKTAGGSHERFENPWKSEPGHREQPCWQQEGQNRTDRGHPEQQARERHAVALG